LEGLVAQPVLGFRTAKPQARKFRAGATPFALALSRVNLKGLSKQGRHPHGCLYRDLSGC
jgi:hypothetical protein